MRSRRGEIATILTIATLVVVGVTAVASSFNLNKKQITSSKAKEMNVCSGSDIVCGDDCCKKNTQFCQNKQCVNKPPPNNSPATSATPSQSGNSCGSGGVWPCPQDTMSKQKCSLKRYLEFGCCVADDPTGTGNNTKRYRWFGCLGQPCKNTGIKNQGVGGVGHLDECPYTFQENEYLPYPPNTKPPTPTPTTRAATPPSQKNTPTGNQNSETGCSSKKYTQFNCNGICDTAGGNNAKSYYITSISPAVSYGVNESGTCKAKSETELKTWCDCKPGSRNNKANEISVTPSITQPQQNSSNCVSSTCKDACSTISKVSLTDPTRAIWLQNNLVYGEKQCITNPSPIDSDSRCLCGEDPTGTIGIDIINGCTSEVTLYTWHFGLLLNAIRIDGTLKPGQKKSLQYTVKECRDYGFLFYAINGNTSNNAFPHIQCKNNGGLIINLGGAYCE